VSNCLHIYNRGSNICRDKNDDLIVEGESEIERKLTIRHIEYMFLTVR